MRWLNSRSSVIATKQSFADKKHRSAQSSESSLQPCQARFAPTLCHPEGGHIDRAIAPGPLASVSTISFTNVLPLKLACRRRALSKQRTRVLQLRVHAWYLRDWELNRRSRWADSICLRVTPGAGATSKQSRFDMRKPRLNVKIILEILEPDLKNNCLLAALGISMPKMCGGGFALSVLVRRRA